MALQVLTAQAALGAFLFGFCCGFGWALAAWLVGKLK